MPDPVHGLLHPSRRSVLPIVRSLRMFLLSQQFCLSAVFLPPKKFFALVLPFFYFNSPITCNSNSATTYYTYRISQMIICVNSKERRSEKMYGNYFTLPNQIFDEGLTASEFVVYCYLVKCSDKSHRCFPSRRTIARQCNISVSTVDKALNGLIDKGLIEKTSRFDFSKEQQQLSNIYTLNRIQTGAGNRFRR